jgi:HEPN domain-containing protein
MNDETAGWLRYADENARSAEILLAAGLLNPAIQNAQQAVEKSLKALRIARGLGLRRTHCIRDLNRDLAAVNLDVGLTDEECELLDSVYTGSRYPGDSVFADFPPDPAIARRCVDLALRTLVAAQRTTLTM